MRIIKGLRFSGVAAICIIFSFLLPQSAMAGLVVNEVMTTNETALQDEFADFDDWIEIHNTGAGSVNIEGMFLTDDFFFPTKFELPDTLIPTGGYIIIWCDNEMNEGPLHTNFKLDGDGEQIGIFNTLFNGNGPVDTLSFTQQIPNVSLGRYPNGTGNFTFMGDYTPGSENSAPYNLPPYITETKHFPFNPTDSDPVAVTATIVEDLVLTEAVLHYNAGAGYATVTMFDDGNHDDGAAGDEIYGASIPAQSNGTFVSYYVSALDDLGLSATDPPTAPAAAYIYEVGYLSPVLYVNEFLASNATTNTDEWGDPDDWVEIFNGSGQNINLEGMYLTDNLDDHNKFVFPDTLLLSGEFLLVWCDGEAHEGPLHTAFKLSAGGEQVGIYDSDIHGNVVIDSLTFGAQTTDISFGRSQDGGPEWIFFDVPTPGATNAASGVADEGASGLRFRLLGNAPNPARDGTRITFQIPDARRVVLRVITPDGREVTRLYDGMLNTGGHIVTWDARDDAGRRVPAGVYFYKLNAGQDQASGKILLIR
ncbi:MAG: lamin tail domain-containing protein [Candidatus Eisenbacteria bacterium]|uniref:Lamin tail domain-containing protein n=1 Tax=Eiseniibacteriota bacterium TaxID=2212470 RepID=A0A948RUG4_UNCEI|nr:lamin tail domain-containing protein [Candidatus Eisenbacteria bacterium]MBU2689909.1 lamin tail domain-containing protein [Candidatus Eisenbacteria bacterium]